MTGPNDAKLVAERDALKAKVKQLEAEVVDLLSELRIANFIIDSAECSEEGCGSPWHSSGAGDIQGQCEGAAMVEHFLKRVREKLKE